MKLSDILDSINGSRHKGIYGLTPKEADDGLGGQLAVQNLQEKFGKKHLFYDKTESKKREEAFFSKDSNALYHPGRFCLVDLDFARDFQKGHKPKRAAICRITKVDFSGVKLIFFNFKKGIFTKIHFFQILFFLK